MSTGRLTDIPGLRVGHWTDAQGGTGCTAVIPPRGMMGAVDVRGGGASVRETELLDPRSGAREVSAIMLSGGSAFGLASADGAMRWCEEQGIGLATGAGMLVPIVPAAVIFDLGITANLRRPGSADGYAACAAATDAPHAVGSVGAGTGATLGKWNGRDGWCKGGLGAASARLPSGHIVAVLAVVNAFGDVLDEDGSVLAGAWIDGRGFIGAAHAARTAPPQHPRLQGTNTTLLCIATNAPVGAVGAGAVGARGKHRRGTVDQPCGDIARRRRGLRAGARWDGPAIRGVGRGRRRRGRGDSIGRARGDDHSRRADGSGASSARFATVRPILSVAD